MKNVYHPSRRGSNFKPDTGKLYVFTDKSVTVMSAWPRPQAWRKRRSRRPHWTHVRPVIHLTGGSLDEELRWLESEPESPGLITPETDDFALSAACLAGFRLGALAHVRWQALIPVEVRDLVSPFRQRQWHMLSFLARCGPAAFDLTASDPALAWALASNWVFHRPAVRQPLRSARALLRRGRRRRDILAWLGFPDTEAARRILAKVEPGAVDAARLLYLRDGLTVPAALKAMAHLPRLNAGVIRIVTDPELRDLVAPAFLGEVAERPDEDHRTGAAYLLRDCVAMHRLVTPGGRAPARFRSLAQLVALHDELVADLGIADPRDLELGVDLDAPFPTPPVQGSQVILPLTSPRALLAEGREQHNCAGSYVERVAVQRRTYVYRVLWPERCTLALERQGDRWVPAELRRACNASPSEATRRVVDAWLAARQAG